MVILVVFKVFLVVKNLEILIQIVPERPIYYYLHFNQNETEWKVENPTHSFRVTNLVLQLILKKTVMSWSSQKKKEGIFCTVCFVRRNFCNICVLFQCIVY